MRVFLVILCLCILGCGEGFVSTEYEYVQKEDGWQLKAPIRYRIRYQWSHDTLAVNILSTDTDGKTDFRNELWYDMRSGNFSCDRFNDLNWYCWFKDNLIDGEVLEGWKMTEGELVWFYWGEQRELKKRRRIGQTTLAF